MRPIERKIIQKLGKSSFSLEAIEEIIDSTSRQEMKKSFPDECHFQSVKYFTKLVANSLLRYKLIERDGNKFKKIVQQKKTQIKNQSPNPN